MKIIIIANGLFPQKSWVDDLLHHADTVICCDGALEKFLFWASKENDVSKDISVVGDGDSLDPSLLEKARQAGLKVKHQIVLEQEYNDLTKATHYAISYARNKGCPDGEIAIDFIGATGLREDHSLGNISLLAYYMETYPGVSFRMVSDYGTLLPMKGHRRFSSHRGQEISIFSLTPDKPVSASGLQYPLQNRCLTSWWQGTLNVALGDSFEVFGGVVIVYLDAE